MKNGAEEIDEERNGRNGEVEEEKIRYTMESVRHERVSVN